MVRDLKEVVVLITQPQQKRSQHDVPLQIEWPRCFLLEKALRVAFTLRLRDSAEVDLLLGHRPLLENNRNRFATNRGENRAQHFLAANDGADCFVQHLDIQRAGDSTVERDVISGCARFQLI